MIQLNYGTSVLSISEENLKNELIDLSFFRDAFLILLNPEVAEKSDLTFNRDEVIILAREKFNNIGYNKDFIDKVFSM